MLISVHYINLNYYSLLVTIDDFREKIIISETKDQLITDDQQDSIDSYTDLVSDKSSKCAVY